MTVIRPYDPRDLTDLAPLLSQLGYPSSASEIAARIKRILGDEDQTLLVSEHAGRVVALAHVRLVAALEIDPYVELALLIVEEAERGKGRGKHMLEAVENWAAKRTSTLILGSQIKRTEAHAFYEGMGFERWKTQHVFRKNLQSTFTP